MTVVLPRVNMRDQAGLLLARVAAGMEAARARAGILDAQGLFPGEDIEALRDAGALQAVVSPHLGGLGIGTIAERALDTAALLRTLGAGSIALGRVFEAHLNALRLVMRYGDADQKRLAAQDASAGHLHGLWVTDAAEPLLLETAGDGLILHGGKSPCSAAGFATRAVVTATTRDGATRLMRLALECGERVTPMPSALSGVRAAAQGSVDFTGTRQAESAMFGQDGDYLQRPDFAAGAWRASAVASGALTALIEAARSELVARGRADDPHQRARLGRMMIHSETARLWIAHAAPLAEHPGTDPDHAEAVVNLARLAVEEACLASIVLVQQSLGMSAMMRRNPVERMCRDLATYLRQPAADEALHEAAGFFAGRTWGAA